MDTSKRAPLEPDDSVANARHGLTLAGVFHGVKARPLVDRHVAQNLTGLAIQLDYPAWRSGRLIERLHSRPQRPIGTQLERVRSSQVWNLLQEFSVEVEFLYPPVLAVSNIRMPLSSTTTECGRLNCPGPLPGLPHSRTFLPSAVYLRMRALAYPSLMKITPFGAKAISVVPRKGLSAGSGWPPSNLMTAAG